MSLTELQMAPAVVGAFVRKRGHDFVYRDINLDLFSCCGCDHNVYIDQTEFLQNKNLVNQSNDIVNLWQQSVVSHICATDLLLINVFSVFSQIPALRLARLARKHAPWVNIIMGGIGSHKKLLGGINEFNLDWAQDFFTSLDTDIFGQLCLHNGLIDDWQPNVEMDHLINWLPQRPLVSYDRAFDFDQYEIDRYQWTHGQQRLPMLGSYGCVRQCSFCDVIKHFPRYSFIEADTITKAVVEAYNQTGICKVQFMDSLVNGSMTNFLKLLQNLGQARQRKWLPEDFSWSGTYICRPASGMLERIHQALPESGVDNLVIGIETGSDRIRFEMQKKFTNADLLHEMKAFRAYGVKASGLFFSSWPTETEQDFQDTLEFFDRLSEFGQDGTLDSVHLGISGFSLIDGTPVDRQKEEIGLTAGPVSWLWRCDTNRTLTFWETIRRRLLMAEWCEMRGINLGQQENLFRRYLSFNLEQHFSDILEYSGRLPSTIDTTQYLPHSIRHRLKIKVINSGRHPVDVAVCVDNQSLTYVCDPGITPVEFTFDRILSRSQTVVIDFKFDQSHMIEWNRYDSGDYYDRNGLYLDDIWLDHRDITNWGWNNVVELSWHLCPVLPHNYHQHQNLRCVTAGMRLSIYLPCHQSLHKCLTDRTQPELTLERSVVDKRLYQRLDRFLT